MFNRFLHVRQPAGFNETLFDVFRASCEVFCAHASKLLEVWPRLPGNALHTSVRYEYGPPSLNDDRTIATLPIGGEGTLKTRSGIEIGLAHLLWIHMPMDSVDGMDQGRTEEGKTQWWPLHQPPGVAHLDPEIRAHLRSVQRR